MDRPGVGIVLPSQRTAAEGRRRLARELRETADAAAAAGADTLWVWDHMLKAPVYQGSWHDPFVSLAAVADFGLRLGTGVLVAPVRPAVQTALAVASLQALSGQQMRLGVGAGWNPTEFAAAGVELSNRGRMTDEFLAVVTAVFAGEGSFSGRFYEYSGLEVGDVGTAPDLWIAGGSRAAGGGQLGPVSQQPNAGLPRSVVDRIARHGRWLIRPTAEIDDFRRDLPVISHRRENLSGDSDVDLAIILVGHLAESDDPDKARDVQLPVLQSFVTDKRPSEYLEARYLVGSLVEIQERVSGWVDAGVGHVGLYLLGDTKTQVGLAQKHLSHLLAFA